LPIRAASSPVFSVVDWISAIASKHTASMVERPTIMKFGGTSVEDATAIRNVAAIVKLAVNSRPVIVVSAIGGFTNSLLASVRKAIAGDARAATKSLDADFDRHLAVAKELLDKESCATFVSTVGDARSKIRQ